MFEIEQVRPLAHATDHYLTNSDNEETVFQKTTCRRKYIRWCSCMAAILILLVVVVVILICTIFKIKEPEFKMNGIRVDSFNLINGSISQPGANISLMADISVKNRRYKNTTTSLYYHGGMIGVVRGPSGQSEARRTTRMNVTINIMVGSLLGNPNLHSDLGTGLFTVSSYTSVGGRVKYLAFIKRQVTVRMNCTVKINIASRAIEGQKCRIKVKL